MYIVSLFKRIFRVSNIGTLIFFILNALMVIGIFYSVHPEAWKVILIIYVISIFVALSPIGEWILCLLAGAQKMTRVDMRNRMVPIVARVHNKALFKTPDMTKIINIKVMYDPNPNAFALGRHTICVTEGLFDLSDDMIEGIVAHEVGHLANHHTDIQLLIGGGNFIIASVILVMKVLSALLTFIGALFSFSRDDSAHTCGCVFSIVGIICSVLVLLWTKFCMLFLMWSSRANEYVADKYAMEIGYGYELAAALDSIGTGMPQSTLMKALYSTHPETHDRIGRLQKLGVPYYRY